MARDEPEEAPPTYEAAVGGPSTSNSGTGESTASRTFHKLSRKSRNGIPPETRRSMEDENRPLPEGWVRSFDPDNSHQFYVDTKADPPRSIWHHPHDDDQYLSTLSSEERERLQEMGRHASQADIAAESTDEEDRHYAQKSSAGGAGAELPERPHGKQKEGLGRRMKDKLTGSTHEQREAQRRKRAEQEARAYEQHQQIRLAMQRAMETGQPQPIGKDKDGHDIYLEPPSGPGSGYGYSGYQGGYGGTPARQYQNPYSTGPYANPNARFIRPQNPYNRPYGGGYGGGYGMPLMLGGGLMGGLLMGDMLGGGFGGGFGGGGL